MYVKVVAQCVCVIVYKKVRFNRVGTGEKEWHFEGFQQLRVLRRRH